MTSLYVSKKYCGKISAVAWFSEKEEKEVLQFKKRNINKGNSISCLGEEPPVETFQRENWLCADCQTKNEGNCLV